MRKPRPLVRKKLWIFDFDNTIARLEPEVDWAGGRRELEPMLRGLGVPEDLFEKFPRGNLPLYSAMRTRLLELAGDRSSGFSAIRVRSILRQASAMIEKYEMAGVDRAAPLDGAIDLLRQLKKNGAKLAIVTSNSSRTVRRWFTLHRMSALLDAIVGRDSLLALKPSAEMIARARDRCGARAKDSAFVGDADSDYLAAAAQGLEFFGVAFSPKLCDQLAAAGARRIFSSPAALGIHLNLLNSPEVTAGDDAEA
ncbi:MAG TPA: HAD family hydrolase [Candidatus Binataceae bacterium]|nr:HAD family hydrolase [Candidatus Binataceae bacterium]